jgi:hypothetical protein
MSAIPSDSPETGESSDDMYLDSKSNVDESAYDGVGSAKTTGKDIVSSDTTQKGLGAVETAGTDITGVSIKGSKQDSQPVSIQGPDYSTSFCRPRPTESTMGKKVSSWILKVNGYLDIGGVSWGPSITVFTTLGTCAIIALLFFYFKEPELFKSFMSGGTRMLWYGFIFFMIITMLALFSHYLYWVAYFFELTVHLFNLTWNPLLDQKVASLCCLFSDYINWLIYYPSMIYFLFCFLFILFIDLVILLPIFIFFGCIIGFLFSMFGQSKTTTDVVIEGVKKVASENVKSPLVQSGLKNMGKVATQFGSKFGSLNPLGSIQKLLPKGVAPSPLASALAPAPVAPVS